MLFSCAAESGVSIKGTVCRRGLRAQKCGAHGFELRAQRVDVGLHPLNLAALRRLKRGEVVVHFAGTPGNALGWKCCALEASVAVESCFALGL